MTKTYIICCPTLDLLEDDIIWWNCMDYSLNCWAPPQWNFSCSVWCKRLSVSRWNKEITPPLYIPLSVYLSFHLFHVSYLQGQIWIEVQLLNLQWLDGTSFLPAYVRFLHQSIYQFSFLFAGTYLSDPCNHTHELRFSLFLISGWNEEDALPYIFTSFPLFSSLFTGTN